MELPEGNYRDDAKLATAANNALAQNVTVPDTVEATAGDGNVTLTGTVSYGTQRAAAEAAVAGQPPGHWLTPVPTTGPSGSVGLAVAVG